MPKDITYVGGGDIYSKTMNADRGNSLHLRNLSEAISSGDPLIVEFLSRNEISPGINREQILSAVLQAFSKIPYENLSKVAQYADLGSRYKSSEREILQGFWKYGTGGTCFPLTATLVYLLHGLGFDAHPILADRRYGSNTHCAVILAPRSPTPYIIDPGYLLNTPLALPTVGTTSYHLQSRQVELRLTEIERRVDLHLGTTKKGVRYRLTYKVDPVSWDVFNRAWDESFDFEMMNYPVLSMMAGSIQIYAQKGSLYLRGDQLAQQIKLSEENRVQEIADRFKIDSSIVYRAFDHFKRRSGDHG